MLSAISQKQTAKSHFNSYLCVIMIFNQTYRCFIVDDDEIDRLTTLFFAKKYPFLDIVGVFDNAETALAESEKLRPQVLLLDIDMREMSGMELRRKLINVDACIFITSYPDFAVESFEMDTLDFLVKPIRAERFDAAMKRLYEYLEVKYKSKLLDYTLNGDTVFIKDGRTQVKLRLHDIFYLEALKDYTGIVTKEKKYCVLASLGNLLNSPEFSGFVRVHRSYAVQKHFVDRVEPQEIWISDFKIPIGRSYKEKVESLVND
ncbi:MAG: LytTR family DNA-binding domain-containing protein [Flavobacteriaceae bacterium]|jgi:DNA-binding LytR/AlgR family response regulator|nr:LytTR family DNA-binding domain-containing protein [Flavobacteriaceae bacterium]